MDFRFVHAADLHLDSPFKGLNVHPRLRPALERATFRALSRMVDLCLRERALFLVLSGDLFDAKDRSVRARLQLAAELGRLSAAGIRTFIVHGNHDPLGALRPGAGLPEGVWVFGPDWDEVALEHDGEVICRVQGISYPQERVSENLARRFRRTGPGFTVGVLHANLGGDTAHANYAPCTLTDLSSSGLDYWALGHVHTRAVYPLAGGGVAVYPGNPQGRHVLEDAPRGCALVEVRDGRPNVRFVEVDAVRWHRLTVDVTEAPTLEELGDAVDAQLSDLGRAEGPEAHAVRITLEGRGPVHRELRRPGALEQLEECWRQAFAERRPPVALESVKDESRPELDFDLLRSGGGLVGAVLELSSRADVVGEELWADDELRKLEARLRALKLPSPGLEGAALVREAAEGVVERLVEDES